MNNDEKLHQEFIDHLNSNNDHPEICECGKKATWIYALGYEDENPYFCDDCVPRGCSCNYYTTDDWMPKEDKDFKWIEKDKIWCYVDEQGRESPCCEFMEL